MTQIPYAELVEFRQQLHSIAELSGHEVETARAVAEKVRTYQPTELIEHLGGTGLAAVFDSGNPGKTVMFRAELDALPIQEVNSFAYVSKNEGVSHKCGHDGHTTTLLGLAAKLQKAPLPSGKVVLLFQPAEENGEGAKAILEDLKFQTIKPDYIFALHNIPNYPLGQIITKEGAFTPSVISLIIRLMGKTSHAAEPENGINPDLAIAELIQKVKALANPNPDHKDFLKVATVYASLGSQDYGISAGEATLHFTIRCWDDQKLTEMQTKITELVNEVSHRYALVHTLEWPFYFAANQNDVEANKIVEESAKICGFEHHVKPFPFSWGEDFGLFTQQFSGAMFGLGAGLEMPALHNPEYDFPDAIIPYGAAMFYTIAQQVLAS